MAGRVIILIVLRGIAQFKVGAVAWIPLMLAAWSAMTCVAILLGPFLRLVAKISEDPGFASIRLGEPRETEINRTEVALARCYAIDSIPGMITPR